MLKIQSIGLFLGFLAVLGVRAEDSSNSGRVPLEEIFQKPGILAVEMSPDGKRVALIHHQKSGAEGIAVMELSTGKLDPLIEFPPEATGDHYVHWKGNDFLVYGTYLLDDFDHWDRHYAAERPMVINGYDLQLRRVIHLSPGSSVPVILDWMDLDADTILIADLDGDLISKLNVRTGKRAVVTAVHGDFAYLLFDPINGTRCRRRFDHGEVLTEVCAADKKNWAVVDRVQPADVFCRDTLNWLYAGFASETQTTYVLERGEYDTLALRTCNVHTGETGPALFHPDQGEITQLIYSYGQKRLYGLIYETDRLHYQWFDPARERLQASIDKALPGTFNKIESTSADEANLVIAAYSDHEPTSWYLLDRNTHKLQEIYRHTIPGLLPVHSIAYPSRDGLLIHGYLTEPATASKQRPPLIILVHDGPFNVRATAEYNPEVQFLVNLGYRVLQPNFRGSGTYGRNFACAGRGEWGRRIQDDIADAVEWAISQGIADRTRVGIYGVGFGGYSAMAGVTFAPQLYCCGINRAGAIDLKLQFSRRDLFGGVNGPYDAFIQTWLGEDAAEMKRQSPVNFVNQIQVPTFHYYGGKDHLVDVWQWQQLRPADVKQWQQLRSALDLFHKNYEFIFQRDEWHDFALDDDRVEFFRHMEAFLSKYLPVASAAGEPIVTPKANQ